MAKASDNQFPSVLFGEQASPPATPAAGTWRAFFQGDGLYLVDDAGAVTGPLTSTAASRRLRAGYYYAADYVARSTGASSNGQMRLAGFVVGASTTFDRIRVEVTSAGSAGSVHRLGIYGSGADGAPDALVLDAGTVDTTTTGLKDITISQALPPGIYWIAVVQQGSPTTTATLRTVTESLLAPNSGAATAAAGWFQDAVTAALPANYSGTLTAGSAPLPMLRAA